MTPRVDAWLRQAVSDLAVARLTAEQGFHAQACYHAGQAAEKALKALLVATGTIPPYSHSLDRLVETVAGLGIDTAPLQALHLRALTRMNSESRYPQDDEAPIDRFDINDSSKAVETAAAVLAFAEAELSTD